VMMAVSLSLRAHQARSLLSAIALFQLEVNGFHLQSQLCDLIVRDV